MVLCVDTPLISAETLKGLFRAHLISQNAGTILTTRIENPFGYGRIIRSQNGEIRAIIEEKDAAEDQRKVKEINSGIYIFQSPLIWEMVSKIKNENKKGEYYLTDVIWILKNLGHKVGAHSTLNADEIIGVNSRLDLSLAEKLARKTILAAHMLNGVTVINPENTYISPDAEIGNDTTVYPGTVIEGKTKIGKNCVLGPNSVIRDSIIGDNSQTVSSFVNGAKLAKNVKVGPFSNIRPGSVLKENSKVGNFSEVKKSTIGEDSKVNHLSYIGDSFVGKKVNIGAGTITCNFDGKNKNKTFIGDRAFIGSNVNLVAPIKIGQDVILAAGSTITENVPHKVLAIARSRQVHKKRKS